MTREELIEKANEIVNELEKDTSQSEYPHQRGKRFKEASALFEEAGEVSRAQELLWETRLFYFPTKEERDEQVSQGERFVHTFSVPFSLEAIEYFKKRSCETANPIHKARYCDFLWDVAVDDAYKFAEEAVAAYLECADLYFKNDWSLQAGHSLSRCVSLSRQLNNRLLQEKTKDRILALIRKWVDRGEYTFCLRPMRAILYGYDNLRDSEIQFLIRIADVAAHQYLKEEKFLLHRGFLKLLLSLHYARKNSKATQEVQYRVVDSYVTQARLAHDTSSLLEGLHYEDALKSALNFGFKEKLVALKRCVREAYERGEKELKPISASARISMKPVDTYIDKLLEVPIAEALQDIALNRSLVPSFSKAKEFSKELDKKYISRHLFPHLFLLGEGMVYRPLSEEEQELARVTKDYLMNARVAAIFLERILTRLREERELDTKSIIAFLEKWDFADSSDLELVELGVDRYFAGDFVSGVHILAPRIENMIRRMLSFAGGDTTAYDTEAIYVFLRNRTLSQLFELPGVKEAFSDDLFYYFYVILLCPYGFNLRNKVSHGLIGKSSCTAEVCSLLIHLLLLLTSFKNREE